MKESEDNKSGGMSFFEHLDAFRWHLMRSAASVVVFAFLAFFFKDIIFDQIILAPQTPAFITNRLLCRLGDFFHASVLCINQKPFHIINLEMAGQFSIHISISIMAGIICSFPYILWEFWRFVSPALYVHERKFAGRAVLSGSFLFLTGVAFGYFVLTPMAIDFLGGYNVSEKIENTINITSYISTISMLVLSCGVIFELPILAFFLTKVGLITPVFMRKYRRHAIVVVFIVAAIITPPDAFSQTIVAIPLMILYEVSIIVSSRVKKTTRENVNS